MHVGESLRDSLPVSERPAYAEPTRRMRYIYSTFSINSDARPETTSTHNILELKDDVQLAPPHADGEEERGVRGER